MAASGPSNPPSAVAHTSEAGALSRWHRPSAGLHV